MSSVTTSKTLNLGQLADELGSPLRTEQTGEGLLVTADDIALDDLEAAIDAHVPAPEPSSAASRLQAQVDELSDLFTMLLMGEL